MSDIVAVFWDFEQFHYALARQQNGRPYGQPQPSIINVEAVMDHARSIGQVVHNEAYCNWRYMARYADKLQLEDTNFVHVWPTAPREPADVYPILYPRAKYYVERNEDITHVVLVGMDDDYLQLADDLRHLGCKLHAIGTGNLQDKEWQAACDDYRTYYDLKGTAAPTNGKQSRRPSDPVRHYLRVAAQQGVRMPPPRIMWIGIDIYATFLPNSGSFGSFNELDEACYQQLVEDVPESTMTEVKKIRQVLFKCFLFRPSEDGMISFQDKIKTLEDIEDCYFDLMLHRIANHLHEPVDYVVLSKALTGEPTYATRLENQHATLLAKTAGS